MEKKMYFAPELDVIELDMKTEVLLGTSDPAEKVDYGEGSAEGEGDLA